MKGKKILISNRLPFSLNEASGELVRSSGGLVSALLGIDLGKPFYWLGFETNHKAAPVLVEEAKKVQPNIILNPVVIDHGLYCDYYDKFCNDTLWPLFHYEGQHTFFHRNYWEAYKKANQLMAEAVLEIADEEDSIWVHDFHLFLLPKLIKEKKPNVKVGVFLHTPFPSSEIYRQLPVREELLNHVILADLLGFHEHSYLRHFSDSMKGALGIDSTFFKASIGNHRLNLGVYPISIDTDRIKKIAESDRVKDQLKKFHESITSEFLVLAIDRLDYSKGLKLKLKGFRRALEKYPVLRDKMNLLQVAIPTRVNVPSYINLKNEIDKLVGEINGAFGKPGYTPVNYIYNSVNETELIALYKRSQSILITSKRDGMNLVAMEYSICQSDEHPGVLILSEFTGAASLLGDGIIINPWDEDSIADAIYKAFTMSLEENRERVSRLQEILTKYSASKWASTFLNDLDATLNPDERYETQNIKPMVSSWPEVFCEELKMGKRLKLFMDYDGTLVGFKSKPEIAVLNLDVRKLLRKLGQKTHLTIISGRSKEFLESQFGEIEAELVAEHGAFYKKKNSKWVSRVSTDIGLWYDEVKRVMKSYTEKVPLSFIEEKKSSIVWHYSQSPKDFALFQARKLDDELQACLANLPVIVSMGTKNVEAKAVECNKGDYLRWDMATNGTGSLYICIGDDKTDEDMFQMIRDRGLSIKVGRESTNALFNLERQSEVAPFLESLADYL